MHNRNKTCMFIAPTDKHAIVKCIDSLKNKNSSGHDKITASLLKNVKHEIVKPLEIILNKSLQYGIVPEQMKLAKVVPIFKAKDKQLLNNYRPISLLPVVSKILEKIVHKRLYGFMNSQDIFFKSIWFQKYAFQHSWGK